MAAPERRGLLTNNDSTAPNTPSSTILSPGQTFRPRATYHRVPSEPSAPSVSMNDEHLTRDITETAAEDEIRPVGRDSGSHGLGIAVGSSRPSPPLTRVKSPLSQQDRTLYSTPRPYDKRPTNSTPSTGGLSGSTRFEDSFNEETSYDRAKHLSKESRASLASTLPPSIYAKSDAGLLSVKSRYESFEPHHNCQSSRAVKQRRRQSWVAITILVLAFFSTIFSTIYLVIALTGPEYGRRIRNGGSLTPSAAAFLTSLFAKLIELATVTCSVAFVGQALARRAFKLEKAEGVTLAELSMRTWIMQPGTMLTQWESVRYAGTTLLGVLSLIAALLAVLYTSAATALVQPQLKFSNNWEEHKQLAALVKTQYANPIYIGETCHTPITEQYDPTYGATTCLQMEHAAMAYHNFFSYLGTWADVTAVEGNGSTDPTKRPQGYALLNDNTTIAAPWVEIKNVSNPAGTDYYINNVTMAMPHVQLVQAAQDPLNKLMQPNDVEGASYNIKGSLPSPMVNVLCVTMTETDLNPLIYRMSNRTGGVCNETDWSDWPGCLSYVNGTDPYLNGTDLDDIFRWGEQYGPDRWPPVFPKLPSDYNTLINETKGLVTTWGRKEIYMLGKGGDTDILGNPTNVSGVGTNYALCQLSAGMTPFCSSHYNASSSGGSLQAVCEDNDRLQYNNSVSDAWSGNDTLSADWPNIASEWARSLSLNAGLLGGNASTARLLTQFILTSGNLSAAMPSTAEALAVLAGCTLIQSATDSTLKTTPWNYTLPTLLDGNHEYFNASYRIQQYASGGNQEYQKPFYVVLFAVVLMNFAILFYFLFHRDWYTDITEPNSLFSLAVNSPPSEKLAGACGSGPSGDMYKVSFKMNNDDGHYYVESHDPTPHVVGVESPRLSRRRWTESFEMLASPASRLTSRFST